MDSTGFAEMMMHMAPPPLPLSPTPAPLQCPELDLSLTLTPQRSAPPGATRTRPQPRPRPRQVRFALSSDPDSESCGSPPVDTPPVTMTIREPCSNQSAAEKRHSQLKPVRGVSAVTDGQLPEVVELNMSLALKAELQQLEEAEFDSQKAVQEKLQNSTRVQECIRSRATEGLNFQRSQQLYRSLISVSLSHDQLLTQALRDRPALAPPTSTHSTKFRTPPAEGPDLFFFYEPHCVVRETPLLPGNRIPLPRPRPAPRPAHTTFHLHQRHRQWEA